MIQADTAVVILAGGEASRLPGKLELDAAGVPLIVRVYRNFAGAPAVYVCAAGSFAPEIDEALQCPIIVDSQPRRGPLPALYNAFGCIALPRVFVTAGDAPFVTSQVVQQLQTLWEPDVHAVVPVNAQGMLEPLCALYDRHAFIGAARETLAQPPAGVKSVVGRLTAKRIRLPDDRVFANVNTPADRRLLLEA